MTAPATCRVVAAHQPNFFPWLGYFDKIARSDVFILLDHVQLPGASGSWVNRVKLLVGGEPRWVTAPVLRPQLNQSILETEFDERSPWRRKLVATLEASYRKASCFDEAFGLLEPLIGHGASRVGEYNIHAIQGIAEALGLSATKMLRSSQLQPTGSSNDLLIDLTKKVGGDAYMRGSGAVYQDDELFRKAGLDPMEQLFDQPLYAQHGRKGEFVPGLSIIDALMNLGFGGTAALLDGPTT